MELLHNCRDHAHKFYGDLLLDTETALLDSLFNQSANSSNNEDQSRYFEATQRLKDRSNVVHTKFKQELSASFNTFINGEDNKPLVDQHIEAGALSLLQRDELEDDLAISIIVSKSNSRNSEALWKLNKRLAVLRGGKAVNDDNNPFGPALVCSAIQLAIAELEFDSKVKIYIYKYIGELLLVNFSKVIESLNDMLVEKNILPNLRFSPTPKAKFESQQPVPIENIPLVSSNTSIESEGSIAHQQKLYEAIRTLQAAIGTRSQTAGGVSYAGISTDGSGGHDTFTAEDYALVLSTIQQSEAAINAAADNQPLPADKVEQQLVDQLVIKGENSSQQKMTKSDADTVDLVGMIFRYMLDDENLHDAVKSMLSHLHTPYLKLALMDKSFLDNYQHSARVLLNSMADVGSKWVKEEKDRTVLPKIKTIVENILKGFVDDETIFDRFLDDFTKFRDNLEKRAQMVEKRNTESQQGLEKLEISKQQANEEINLRLQQANINDDIAALLNKPWSDFLAFNLLRHGNDSITWESALKVVDGIIWSVRPEAIIENKDEAQHHQAELEKSVIEGLNTIGYDAHASKSLLVSIRAAHELAYGNSEEDDPKEETLNKVEKVATSEKENLEPQNKTSSKQLKEVVETAPATIIEKAADEVQFKKPLEKKVPEKLTPEEKSWLEKLTNIAFGTWFEFEQNNISRKLKLAWYSKVSQNYMFVDHAGVKQSVEDQYDLIKGMCAGNIRIAAPLDKSLMERTLEKVFNRLKSS